MESLIVYLAKVSAALLFFMAVYAIFLRKTTFFCFNRCFLLIGFAVSLAMPFVKYTYEVVIPMQEYTYLPEIQIIESGNAVQTQPVDVWSIIAAVYMVGILLFLCRNIYMYAKLRRLIKEGELTACKGYKIVDNPAVGSPFTFINYILLNAIKLSRTEKELILKHEKIHIEQKHWIDLLCSECMLLLQWFNPFAWLYVRLLKENHEYLADKAVIETGVSPAVYQAVLINQEFQGPVFSFSNSFSYPKSLKRLDMVKKTKSASWKRIAALLIVPALGLYLWASAEPRYVMQELPEVNAEMQSEDTVAEIVSYTIDTKGKNSTVTIYSKDGKGAATVNDSIAGEVLKIIIDKHHSSDTISKEMVLGLMNSGTRSIMQNKDDTVAGEVLKIIMDKHHSDTITKKTMLELVNSRARDTMQGKDNHTKIRIRGIGNLSSSGKQPLIFIDDEKATVEDLNKMDVKDIKSFSVLKGKSATDAYGDEGKDGAIIISTKEDVGNVKGVMIVTKKGENTPRPIDSKVITMLEAIATKQHPDSISKTNLKIIQSEGDNTEFFIRGVGNLSSISLSENPPLVFIDDEKSTMKDLNKLDVNEIKSFKILKDKSATDIYGEEGKNGVILITTEKGDNSTAQKLKFARKTGINIAELEDMIHKSREYRSSQSELEFLSNFKENEGKLIFMDGKKMSFEDYAKYSFMDDPKSLQLLLGEETKEYGEEGKNGVLIISTKDS